MVEDRSGRLRRRVRVGAAWTLTVLVVGVYVALPDGEDSAPGAPAPAPTAEPGEPRKLEIGEISPADAPAGSAIIVSYSGASEDEARSLKAFAGKEELEVLSRAPSSIVARLPANLRPGHIKIRVTAGDERSKPYDMRIKPQGWRKPFRSLVGGFALLVFGIGILARGAREAVGLRRAQRLALVAGRSPAAFGFGTIMGALVQSTSAAAGLLAGLVVSSLLAVAPAAVAFLGAQIGAAAAPLLVTGLIDLRVGLIVVAVGILWLGLATDRRATALGRLVLGAGLISFGLQTMRPGFEPFVSNPALLPVLNRLQADSIPGVLTCALLGAMLVAALQGPAPVLVLVLGISQTTGHWDLRTALAVLSGSGLGAALGALFTIPAGPRCRRLAQLYLVLGLGSTLIAAATVDVWCQLADRLMAGSPHEIRWGKRVVLPNLGRHLSAAFAFSQLAVALVLLPFVGIISRFLERIWPEAVESTRVRPGAATAAARDGLLVVVRTQRAAITPIAELALTGMRAAGRAAEHELADAEASLRGLLAGPVRALPATPPGQVLARTSFACLQLQRALEGLLRQAERLTDTRVASAGARDVPPLPPDDEAIVLEMQALFSEGLAALGTGLETGAEVDLEAARAREIRMNGLEARARDALLAADREPAAVARHLAVLELVDAYETAGNQVYRLAEALGESYTQTHVAAI